jgi:hypothetical protein
LLFSCLHCCSSFLFTLLLSSPLCIVVLLFTLLLSSLPHYCFPICVQVQVSSQLFFFGLLLFLCSYLLKDLVLPPPFPLIRIIGSCQESTTCVFFSFFFFFHVFCSSILIAFYFGLWCKAWLGMNCFENKHKPFEKKIYNFVSLLICNCFGSFLVVHKSFVNVCIIHNCA